MNKTTDTATEMDVDSTIRAIYCLECQVQVQAHLKIGRDVDTDSTKMAVQRFWQCPTCENIVRAVSAPANNKRGLSADPHKPIGSIPNQEARNARHAVWLELVAVSERLGISIMNTRHAYSLHKKVNLNIGVINNASQGERLIKDLKWVESLLLRIRAKKDRPRCTLTDEQHRVRSSIADTATLLGITEEDVYQTLSVRSPFTLESITSEEEALVVVGKLRVLRKAMKQMNESTRSAGE